MHLPVARGEFAKNSAEMWAGDEIPGSLVGSVLEKADSHPKADDFFARYLRTSVKENTRYHPSTNDKVLSRATDAASRIFFVRDTTGNRRINTAYLLRVLTSVAADNASRRYRARSGAAPLSDFGSAVGNDAGLNLLHEFGPGIRQKVSGHLPEFVSHLAAHLQGQPRGR